jgi:hypothetical protein
MAQLDAGVAHDWDFFFEQLWDGKANTYPVITL